PLLARVVGSRATSASVVLIRRRPSSSLVPYTTLFRSRRALARGDDPEKVLEQLAQGLTQKYLHGPLSALNKSEGEQREQLLEWLDRKSTRLNSSHVKTSYAVFCLKKKKRPDTATHTKH